MAWKGGAVAIETARVTITEKGTCVQRDLRNQRPRSVRARSVSVRALTRRVLERGRADYPEPIRNRPVRRLECVNVPRPCPYVGCKYNLYVDVDPKTGTIKLNFPDIEPHEMGVSCALDVADEGGATLEEVGSMMNLTRERIRQVEIRALRRIAVTGKLDGHVADETRDLERGRLDGCV